MTINRKKIKVAGLIILTVVVSGCFQLLMGQDNKNQELSKNTSSKNQNTLKTAVKKEIRTEPVDTNFTFEKYADFLKKVSDTSKYIVVPINEFRKTFDSDKIVIGLRHDVDNDLTVAQRFSVTEKNLGFRSTYYILHTANYYLADPSNKAIHTDSILPVLRDMQNNGHFEIGWHNDLITLQVVYHIDPVNFLHLELDWLRKNGINVVGTSSHGSAYCRVYYYINFYFFDECTWPVVQPFVNNVTVPDASGTRSNIKKGKLSDFGLEYEAYFLNNNKYFSDASITNGVRWNIGMLDLNALKKGDRVIILLHPIHWHQAYAEAQFADFRIPGQLACKIDPDKQTIRVVMPAGSDIRSLSPVFILPSGAYARAAGVTQTSGVSRLNFTSPVTYSIVAENRAISKNWTVTVDNTDGNTAEIEAFTIPGSTKQVSIDPVGRSILVRVRSNSSLNALTAGFRLSNGATAWINDTQQFSNEGTVDFTSPVTYRIVSDDGLTEKQWKVKVELLSGKADITAFRLPGMTRNAAIRQDNHNVEIEVRNGQLLYSLPAHFEVSSNARAYINGIEQTSGISVNSFYYPVTYSIVSEDSMTFNAWKISVKYESFLASYKPDSLPSLSIYPNPSRGKTILKLTNVTENEPRIDIFNSMGRKIYSSVTQSASLYFKEVDLTGCPPGIYVAKCSSVSAPAVFMLER